MLHKLTLTTGLLASLALSGAAQNLLQNQQILRRAA